MDVRNEENRIFSRFLKRLFAASLALFAFAAGLVFVFDPFYHFHAPFFGMRPVLTEKEYQVDGTLKNFSYDALLLGSSHSDNFDLAQAKALFGKTFVKGARSWGNFHDLCAYADTAFATRAVSLVLFNADAAPLRNPETETLSDSGFPLYLTDNNPFNDIRYLLNKDVLLRRIPYAIAQSSSPLFDASRSYSWHTGKDFSRAAVLQNYPRHPRIEETADPASGGEAFERNCARVIALVEAHPEAEFIFFFPPVSMLFWDSAHRAGTLEQTLYEEETFLTRILAYDNVSAYYFCTDEALITNLDRYMDFTHYDERVNDDMLKEMADPASVFRLQSPEDVPLHMKNMRALLDRLFTHYLPVLEEEDAFHYSDG